MSTEEFLKPRYKVIADYPLSKMYFNVGDVLTWDKEHESYRIGAPKYIAMAKETVESYPHLFKRLEWWEERNDDEMPEYVKTANTVKKVYRFCSNKIFFTEQKFRSASRYLPATKEEYEAFKQSQTIEH